MANATQRESDEKNRLCCERANFRRAVSDICDAQFIAAIRAVDSVGQPFAVGRKTAAHVAKPSGRERFKLTVVGGSDGRFCLRAE